MGKCAQRRLFSLSGNVYSQRLGRLEPLRKQDVLLYIANFRLISAMQPLPTVISVQTPAAPVTATKSLIRSSSTSTQTTSRHQRSVSADKQSAKLRPPSKPRLPISSQLPVTITMPRHYSSTDTIIASSPSGPLMSLQASSENILRLSGASFIIPMPVLSTPLLMDYRTSRCRTRRSIWVS